MNSIFIIINTDNVINQYVYTLLYRGTHTDMHICITCDVKIKCMNKSHNISMKFKFIQCSNKGEEMSSNLQWRRNIGKQELAISNKLSNILVTPLRFYLSIRGKKSQYTHPHKMFQSENIKYILLITNSIFIFN